MNLVLVELTFSPKAVVEEVATTSLDELATTSFLTALHKMSWTAAHADYDSANVLVFVFVLGSKALCSVLLSSRHPATIWSMVSWNWRCILHLGSVPSLRILF